MHPFARGHYLYPLLLEGGKNAPVQNSPPFPVPISGIICPQQPLWVSLPLSPSISTAAQPVTFCRLPSGGQGVCKDTIMHFHPSHKLVGEEAPR